MLAKCVLLAVKSDELCTFGLSAHNNLLTFHHVGVEAMHRLTVCHHHIVGDVDDVVDRTQTYNLQFVLQPLGALLHLAACDAYASIAAASLGVLYLYVDRHVVVVDVELRAVGTVQRCLVTIALEPSIEVARYAPVRECVRAVGCDVYLDNPVALQVIILGSRLTDGSVLRQHDDAIMSGAHANLVFGTNHTKRLYAAELRLLDRKLAVAVVEHAAQVGNDNLLTSSYVRCAADNLLRLALAEVDGCDMKVV